MIDNCTVGKTIALLRQAKGMTQQQLAAAMNVSHQAVSKWENGAALPDIQTLMELTQFFGVTVEQLLSGEIPEARLETQKTLDDHLHHIGSFVNGVFDDIGGFFRPESKEKEAEKAEAPREEAASGEAAEDCGESNLDIEQLLAMAPFMSKGAVEDMLRSGHRKLTSSEIAQFAPFVSSAFLEKLIRENEPEITWETLRRIAPFLKREVVDTFAKMIATGEKFARPATEEVNRAAEDVCKAVDNVSRKLGKGVDKAVRKAVKLGENVVSEVTKAFDGFGSENSERAERQAKLRRSAFERALADGKWDWIEAHIGEVTDEELKRKISDKANSLGMQDWVSRNLAGYVDAETIDRAIADGDWSWLGEHVAKFDADCQQRVARAAMEAENWQWLSNCAEQIALDDCVMDIAAKARRSGARMLAVQLARYDMFPEQAEQTALEAVDERDYEYIEMISDLLSGEAMCRCCIRMAKAGEWDGVERFADKLDAKGLEWLMEIAIDAGDFEAIDRLNERMNATGAEV